MNPSRETQPGQGLWGVWSRAEGFGVLICGPRGLWQHPPGAKFARLQVSTRLLFSGWGMLRDNTMVRTMMLKHPNYFLLIPGGL